MLKSPEAGPSLLLLLPPPPLLFILLRLLLLHCLRFHRPEYFSLMNLESSFAYVSSLKTLLVNLGGKPFVLLQQMLHSCGLS